MMCMISTNDLMGMRVVLIPQFFFVCFDDYSHQSNCRVFFLYNMLSDYILDTSSMTEPNLVTDTTRPFMLDIKALVPTQFSPFTKSYLYYYQLVHKHRYSYVFSALPNKRKRELNKYPCILMTQCAGLL